MLTPKIPPAPELIARSPALGAAGPSPSEKRFPFVPRALVPFPFDRPIARCGSAFSSTDSIVIVHAGCRNRWKTCCSKNTGTASPTAAAERSEILDFAARCLGWTASVLDNTRRERLIDFPEMTSCASARASARRLETSFRARNRAVRSYCDTTDPTAVSIVSCSTSRSLTTPTARTSGLSRCARASFGSFRAKLRPRRDVRSLRKATRRSCTVSVLSLGTRADRL